MISEFVQAFQDNKDRVRRAFSKSFPTRYDQIVREVVLAINGYESYNYGNPDPTCIHAIDDGEYQGTLVYVIPEWGSHPHDYWYVRVWYGSCSYCDALQGIGYCGYERPTSQQLDDVMMLALHVVQGLRKMGDDE